MTRLLFFGRLRDVAGEGERELDLPVPVETLADLRAWLASDDAALGQALNAHGVHVAIDRVMCTNAATPVRGAREIAFMPALSGG
jgi:molybdopterin synthase sulfur carrier subunit